MRLLFSLLMIAVLFAAPADAATKAKAGAHKAPAVSSAAQNQPPDMFLRGLYDHYIGEYSHGLPLGTGKQLRAVFTSGLAALIEADRRNAKVHGEAPRLDGDPLVDAQEWKISHMRISIENETPGRATAIAHFENMGRDTSVTLMLVKGRAGWRVNDIIAPSGALRDLLGGGL